jgi:hypothetical protein
MPIIACWTRLRLRLSPALLSATFLLVNVAIVASKYHAAMPSSERWG